MQKRSLKATRSGSLPTTLSSSPLPRKARSPWSRRSRRDRYHVAERVLYRIFPSQLPTERTSHRAVYIEVPSSQRDHTCRSRPHRRRAPMYLLKVRNRRSSPRRRAPAPCSPRMNAAYPPPSTMSSGTVLWPRTPTLHQVWDDLH